MRRSFFQEGNFILSLLLGGILAVYFFYALQHIGKFITADEHYWVNDRIPQYWEALRTGDWNKTLINDKPGITLALVTFPGYLFESISGKHCNRTEEKVLMCDTVRTEKLLFIYRFPIILVNAFLILLLFWILTKVTNREIALWGTFLMAVSPRLLGISQVVNPDALLWSVAAVSIFSYLAFLRHQERKFIVLSGVFLGFALLAKYTASILIPFYLCMSFGTLLVLDNKQLLREKLHERQKKSFLSLFFVYGLALLIILIFLPALWSKPQVLQYILSGGSETPLILLTLVPLVLLLLDSFLLKGWNVRICHMLFQKARDSRPLRYVLPGGILLLFSTLIIGRVLFPEWQLFEKVPFDLKDLTSNIKGADMPPTTIQSLLLEANPFVFSLPFIVVPVILSQAIRIIRSGKQKIEWSFVVSILQALILVHLVAFVVMDVLATPRYLIVLFPVASLLAAIEIAFFQKFLSDKKSIFSKQQLQVSFTVCIIVVSILSLAMSSPFYSNYTNLFLPKSEIISDTWGYGGYEAAQYLNSLPNAENLLVWSDYEGVCEFFKGKCIIKQYKHAEGQYFDYAVLTRRGGILYNPDHIHWAKEGHLYMKPAYDNKDPDWLLNIGERPGSYVKVVKVDNVFRASIITDIDHCPSRESASPEHLAQFNASVEDQKADFVISLGDNASHRLRNCSATGDMDARYIAEVLRSSHKPTYFVLGDHDIASSVDSYQSWLETTARKETYYSFDVKDVHVVVLDTVLGGEPMRPPCPEDDHCRNIESRLSDIKNLNFSEYQTKYPDSVSSRSGEIKAVRTLLAEEEKKIALTRSFGNRDRGRLSETELTWLKKDIETTPLQKLLIFSDHPLFPFTSNRKAYDIVNGNIVREVLEHSGKKVVAISGEAHLWHEENINGVQYYIVDEFRKANGSWAYFTWDRDDFHLDKITH